jgi:transposase
MWYIGLDAHWSQSTICVLDGNGKKVQCRTIHGHWSDLINEVKQLPRPFDICFEASTGYGYLFEQLSHIAHRVVVAHPGQLRLIFRSKRKNDRVDAQKLAQLLLLDAVPPVYVPAQEVRSWRAAIEFRQRLIRERTQVKNQIRALLRTYAQVAPRNLWSAKNRVWLQGLTWPTDMATFQRDLLLDQLKHLEEMTCRAEKTLNEKAKSHPGVQLLMTIPGVGIRTAEAVVAYVDNPERFHKNKSIGRYFGLIPCQDASAGVNRLGHITREGPSTVRKLLTEAAWKGSRRSPQIRSYLDRVQRKDPQRNKIAIVATAHYLLRVMLAMLRTGELWHEKAA